MSSEYDEYFMQYNDDMEEIHYFYYSFLNPFLLDNLSKCLRVGYVKTTAEHGNFCCIAM